MLFVIVMWIVNLYQFLLDIPLDVLGIYPRENAALIGIVTAPIIHGSWEHLISNTLPILILGILLFLTYNRIALLIWVAIHLLTGTLVWLLARSSYHVGASGIIYGVASFLFFSAWFRLNIKAIAIASIVALFYGSLIWGVLPIQEGVSWESHLLGAIVGLILAYFFRSIDNETINLPENTDGERNFSEFIEKENQ